MVSQCSETHTFSSYSESPTPILQLHGVTLQFSRTDLPAVFEVNLTLQGGQLLGLLGPSGCGKTTLLRLIAGFERPQSGLIELGGRPVAGAKDGASVWVPPESRGVGMVFQDYALFPHLTVAQNVAFGLRPAGTQGNKKKNRERVMAAIALVQLTGFEDRYPHELSGGQQQRVAIARALAPEPTLVLLDEPLSNLDVQVRHQLRQELREILKKAGTSAIFVTHDQEEALSISDQVAVMRLGRIEQSGNPETVYHCPASQFVAEFVTQANFLPARRQGSAWETELGLFELPPEAIALSPSNTPQKADQGLLMIRQEALQLTPVDGAPIRIGDRQFLGRDYRYQLHTETGQTLIARTTAEVALPPGQAVQVTILPSTLRLFL